MRIGSGLAVALKGMLIRIKRSFAEESHNYVPVSVTTTERQDGCDINKS
jgi:hypothetical protein